MNTSRIITLCFGLFFILDGIGLTSISLYVIPIQTSEQNMWVMLSIAIIGLFAMVTGVKFAVKGGR